MLTCSPLGFTEFLSRLNRDIWTLSTSGQDHWENYQFGPQRFKCYNPGLYDFNEIFVVAKQNQHLIVFDEKSNQFGLSEIDEKEIVKSWLVIGTLEQSLQSLSEFHGY